MGFEVSFKAIDCLSCSNLLWKLIPCFGCYDVKGTVAIHHELSSRDFQGQWVMSQALAFGFVVDQWVLQIDKTHVI